jgi:hypothetical protein
MNAIWDRLITPPAAGDVLNLVSAAYLVVYLVGFVACAYWLREVQSPVADAGDVAESRRDCVRTGLGIFGAGLVFFAIRALQIDPLWLGAPIWMIAAVIALMVAGWRCVEARRRS